MNRVAASSDVSDIMDMKVDYPKHPAFAEFADPKIQDSDTAAYFSGLDKLWRDLNLRRDSAEGISEEFRDGRRKLLEPISSRVEADVSPDYQPYVKQALENSSTAILKEILVTALAQEKQYSTGASTIAQTLKDKSVMGFHLTPSMKSDLLHSLAPEMKKLKEMSLTNSGARCFVVPNRGGHWNIVKRFLKENEIEEGISAYSGYPLELSGYALTYSHPGECWFKVCYADIDLDAPRTVQMHYDEENTSAKSMLYLNEIGSDNGPFSYVPRQKLNVSSRSQLSFFKCLDYSNEKFADDKGVGRGIYNRALFGTKSLRPHFSSLPLAMQGSSCFGDDVLDETPLSRFLIGKEEQVTSKVGDFALFAGGETLHRGGVVTHGERFALQMIYKSVPSFREKFARRAGSALQRARKVLGV